MSIHDNLIYKAFLEFLEKEKRWFRIHFSWDKEKYVEFYTEDGELIDKIDIDLPQVEFLQQVRRFKTWYRRMKKTEMDGK